MSPNHSKAETEYDTNIQWLTEDDKSYPFVVSGSQLALITIYRHTTPNWPMNINVYMTFEWRKPKPNLINLKRHALKLICQSQIPITFIYL